MKRKRIIEIAILVLITVVIIIATSIYQKGNQGNYETSEDTLTLSPKTEYGIVIDSLLIFRDQVKKNQFLSDILLAFNVDYQTIDLLAKRSKDIFDVRKIRAGNTYSVICTNDSLKKVCYFVYESSPTDYVV